METNVINPETPAVATQTAPQEPATSVQTQQVATPPASVGANPNTPTPPDGWVPSYRVRETREAALREAQQLIAQKDAEYRAELQRVQSQLHALVGATPNTQDPQIEAVRSQFSKLFPGLAKFESRAEELEKMLERSGDLESQNQHYWQTYGRQTMDRLFSTAQEAIGAPLNDEARRLLHSQFVGFIQSSPELTERYSSDPTIVDDFWKAFTSSFIDPVRRSAAAGIVGRAPQALPQDTPGGAPRVSPAPQHGNLDDRAAAAWIQYQSQAR